MGKIHNISFCCNFIDPFTKKILEVTNDFQYPDNTLIILPHRRFKNAFFQQKIFNTRKVTLFPQTITFASIDENMLEFDGFCKDLSKFVIHSFGKRVITNDQLSILLQFIIENLKQKNENLEFDIDFLNTLDVGQLKKAIFECYHYQYDLGKIFPYSQNEKVLFRIIKELENYLKIKNLSLKAIFLNNAVNEIIKRWNYNATKKIFTILPQTDVKYISSFLNHLTKYKNAFIFIRGLDRKLYQEAERVSKTHHQHHIVNFLHRNKITLDVIQDISSPQNEFVPLMNTSNNKFNPNKNTISNNINIVSAKNQDEEAKIVSLITREQLAKGVQGIVIQTKSVRLATKIESFLKFWNIAVDNLISISYKGDQARMLFLMTAHYLNLVENDYLLLLDILKSKFCRFNDRDELKEFELGYLRKCLFRKEISNYFKDLEKSKRKNFLFLLELEQTITVARKELKTGRKTLCKYFQIHSEIFNLLKKDFEDRDFEELLLSTKKSLEMFKHDSCLKFSSYIKILEKLLHANLLPTNTIPNCPVRILQTFEMRNIQHEMLIFAGLNEGIFPSTNLDHGYFQPYTRVASKLKSFDTELGFMEYDFVNSCFNRKVVLSYSESLDNKNARSSKCRWLEKILICKKEKQRSELYTNKYRNWMQELQHKNYKKDIEYVNIDISLRPKEIYVSGIEKLISNPYVYYAKYILKLESLEDIARQSVKKEFGVILHNVLSKISLKDFSNFEEYANKFNSVFLAKIKKRHIPFKIVKLWSTRLENIINNVYQYIHKSNISTAFNEVSGKTYLELNNREICVSCRADTIQLTKKNNLKILDYKAGQIPTITEVNQGIYPQPAIEKLILSNGGFKEIDNSGCNIDLAYLDISGKLTDNIEKPISINVTEVESGLKKLLEKFLCSQNEFFIATNKKTNNKNTDYVHFIRTL